MIPYTPIHELVAATHTPFHEDGSLAPEVVQIQARFLAANGIRTVFISGSTGESHSLTCAEKGALYEAWSAAGIDHGLAVIAHVGGNCLEDAKRLARQANGLGFAAFSALAPSYYKPGNLAALISCCAAIAEQAPDLPFYYYDIPGLTGVKFPMESFLNKAPARIPNLAGIKYTNPDLASYRLALETAGSRFDLPWGCDEQLLAAMAVGAKGGVGSSYNWAPRLYHDLIDAFNRGDLAEARTLQTTSVHMINAIAANGYLGTAKALMTRLGVPVGPPRLPLEGPSESQFEAVMEQLEALGIGQWGAVAPAAAVPDFVKA